MVLKNGHAVAKSEVISWWHRRTEDHRYQLPGHKGKIGAISACYQGINRCADVASTV
ncbi:hypothetical protein [Streptomyces sp. NPDC015125]|uniref:hypothetical protein n=1 Tax=Streptomyces sp. NPDC015125 TaxID=3364938 RepID=UPI003700A7D9